MLYLALAWLCDICDRVIASYCLRVSRYARPTLDICRLRALIGRVSRAVCSRQQCDERSRGLRIVCCASLSDGQEMPETQTSSLLFQHRIVFIEALRVPTIMLQPAWREKHGHDAGADLCSYRP